MRQMLLHMPGRSRVLTLKAVNAALNRRRKTVAMLLEEIAYLEQYKGDLKLKGRSK